MRSRIAGPAHRKKVQTKTQIHTYIRVDVNCVGAIQKSHNHTLRQKKEAKITRRQKTIDHMADLLPSLSSDDERPRANGDDSDDDNDDNDNDVDDSFQFGGILVSFAWSGTDHTTFFHGSIIRMDHFVSQTSSISNVCRLITG